MPDSESESPSRAQLLLMLVVAAASLAAGWFFVYAAYRYLSTDWQ